MGLFSTSNGCEYILIDDEKKANELDFKSPFYELEFNFVLEKN